MLGEEDISGDVFNQVYNTTVKCIETGEVMIIPKEDFLKLKNQHVWSEVVQWNQEKTLKISD